MFFFYVCEAPSSIPAGQGRDGYAERAARLFRLAGQLKRLADQYQLAVVITNQVLWQPHYFPVRSCASALHQHVHAYLHLYMAHCRHGARHWSCKPLHMGSAQRA